MPFVSELALRLPLADDKNLLDHAKAWSSADDGTPQSVSGYIPRDFDAEPLASGYGAKAADDAILARWPQETWKERFEELERTGRDIPSLLRKAFQEGVWLGLNQNPTNYCWCYGVVHAYMIRRLQAGEPFLRLSPYSVACIVKDFRNIGGWGSQALAQIVREGVATEEFWPQERPGMSSTERRNANLNAIRNGRQYLQTSRANAAFKKCDEFDDLPSRSWAHKMAYLCEPLPVASGYNRIGHERCTIAGIITSSGQLGAVDLDSYTSDGSPDLKAYSSNFGAGEDMVVPRAPTPSNA